MVKLNNNNQKISQFVIFLFFALFFAACSSKYNLQKYDYQRIELNANASKKTEIETFLAPYQQQIQDDLNKVLCMNLENLDKTQKIGQYQSVMGNWMSDVCLAYAKKIFEQRTQDTLHACLLNHGGIRAALAKGDVQTKNAYEIMPFENSLVVLSLSADKIEAMVKLIYTKKTPHPLAGIEVMKNGDEFEINVQGKLLDPNKIYQVATSDYLAEGGDDMHFFENPQKSVDLDYKIRALIIDYFVDVDTITVNKNLRLQ